MSIPRPGVYTNVPASTYLGWQACSASQLKALRESPAHAISEAPRSDALDFGSAVDMLLLEPDKFSERFVTPGQCAGLKKAKRKGEEPERCSNDGKILRAGQWYCGVHDPEVGEVDPRTVLDNSDARTAQDMIESLQAHSLASSLVREAKARQLCIVWNDPYTGLLCKARIDMFGIHKDEEDGKSYSVHTDLKTARYADPRGFWYASLKFGYPLQAVHYREGCLELDRLRGKNLTYRRFFFLCVCKTPDLVYQGKRRHRVEVFEFTEDLLEAHTQLRAELMADYAKRLAAGEWPYRTPKLTKLTSQPPRSAW